MVQLNKDERVWVCFEMARMQNAHAVQTVWSNRRPVRRVYTIDAILKNYRKYRQYGTVSLVFGSIVIKKEIKDKKLWFQSITSFRLLQLIAQSIFVRF